MTDIPLDHRKKNIVSKLRQENIVTDEFTLYQDTDPFFKSLEQLFINDENQLEHVSGQELVSGSSIIHYQVPYEKRGDGIKAGTINISYNSNVILDDGEGNLYNQVDENTTVGNVWYGSGNITLKNEAPLDSFVGQNVDVTFKRNVFFIENKIYIDVNSGQYNRSSNVTFKDSGVKYPHISCIYLYNEDNELIAKAQLSKPISTEVDLFFVLDDLETL